MASVTPTPTQDPQPAPGGALNNRQVFRAALVVLLGFLASGVLGFVRTLVLSAQFGAGEALDAFYAAQRIPEIIFVLVAGGALGSSFIPVFARQREASAEEGWKLASAVMTLSAGAAIALSTLVILIAPLLVEVALLPGKSPEAQALTTDLMRWMMVTPVIFSISGLVMGILQSHGLFLLPSLAISMNSLGIIFGALVLAPLLAPEPNSAFAMIAADVGYPFRVLPIEQVGNASVYGLAYGAILSAVLHLLVQLPGLISIGAKLRFLPNWRIEGVLEVLRLMGPRVLGLAVVQLNFVVNIILTSGMIAGSLAALNTAFNLMFFALGIIGQSVGAAVFPTLSALYAKGDLDGYKDRLANAMRSVLFLAYPATVAFIVLGEPIVSIFERGEWTPTATQATAWALSFYAIGIAGFALLEVLSRAFYALADTWTPVLVGIGAMVSNIGLSLIFVQFIGDPDSLARGSFAGLALANALTTLVESLLLWWLLHRRIGGIEDRRVLVGSAKAIAAALVMGVILWILPQLVPLRGLPLALLGAVVGGAVFFGVSIGLGLPEAQAVPMMILRRVRR
ncbi:MAG: murein biosynthesis integral membrane protein MurJ [Anaerolineae bacterium]|nr:murein biosynthesis integral membrane protein MurJ [Anaerolineae bacterium]